MSGILPLEGKIAFVTGGSRGIGAAIVRRLAGDGAKVAFTYASSAEAALAVQDAVHAAGGEAFPILADSGEPARLRGAVEEAAGRFGRIDILVNSAGIAITGPIADYSVEHFDRMMAINVRPIMIATQAALPHMPDGSRIIAIGSTVADRTTFPNASVYAASKAAVAALVRGMAIDLAARSITVNTVQPGPTATEMSPENGPRAAMLKNMVPLGRMAQDKEIAGLVAYLAGPDAAFVTAAAMTINGGLHA